MAIECMEPQPSALHSGAQVLKDSWCARSNSGAPATGEMGQRKCGWKSSKRRRIMPGLLDALWERHPVEAPFRPVPNIRPWLCAALGALFVVMRAGATVAVAEPSDYMISQSDVICVAEVDRVFGRRPFTNGDPPELSLTVRVEIKGAKREELLRLSWVTGTPLSAGRRPTNQDSVRWRSEPVMPPAPKTRLLLFLKREGQQVESIWGMDGPVFIPSPDPRMIEIIRGRTWLEFKPRNFGEVDASRRPIELEGTLMNHASDSMSFDLRLAQESVELPWSLKPRAPRQARFPAPLRLGPNERRAYSIPIEALSPSPMGVPGEYWVRVALPARVDERSYAFSLHFRIAGETKLEDAAAVSWLIFVATVDSIIPFRPEIGPTHGVMLGGHRALLGDLNQAPPGNVYFVDWHTRLPLRPRRGGRYIFFVTSDWWLYHVAEMNDENLRSVEAGLITPKREK